MDTSSQFRAPTPDGAQPFDGPMAVLGMDIRGYSRLEHADQISVVQTLHEWVRQACRGQGVTDKDWRWNSGGDGGYLTFTSSEASRKAIHVAFAIATKTKTTGWSSRQGERLELRMALHAGVVQEAHEMGKATNVWGSGINETSRILDISLPSQVLVSEQYIQHFVSGERARDFEFGEPYVRTVKHGVRLKVRNVNHNGACQSAEAARASQWLPISRVRQRVVDEYKNLFEDALQSSALFPALAAARFLLDFGEKATVAQFCERLTGSAADHKVRHWLFGNLTPDILHDVLNVAEPRRLAPNHVLCELEQYADSCFLPVTGRLAFTVPGDPQTRAIADDAIVGEFGLWVPNCRRTAKVWADTECLVLMFRYADFQSILGRAPLVYEILKAGIKRKIVDNICSSQAFFPLSEGGRKLVKERADCLEYAPGKDLDLTAHTYFLFSGRAELTEPTEGKPLPLAAHADFSKIQVLGVRSKTRTCDGPTARTVDPSVLVRVPTETLLELQKEPECGRRWARIWGERMADLSSEDG